MCCPHLLCGSKVDTDDAVDVVDIGLDNVGLDVGVVRGTAVGTLDDNILAHKGLHAVAREHGNHGVEDNLGTLEVSGGALYQDILCLERDLGMVSVDDGGEGKNAALIVVDHRVHGRIFDDVEVVLQFLILPQVLHELDSVHHSLIVEWRKRNVLGRKGLVGEGPLDSVQVVRANRHQSTAPAAEVSGTGRARV
jgi:hypothetical protein